MKRAPLKRRAPLRPRVSKFAPRSRGKTKHARRERGWEYMAWVKTQPCYVTTIVTASDLVTWCSGGIEADHAGSKTLKGDGLRARDATCIPLCARHHRERHGFSGTFRSFDQIMMRSFLEVAIMATQRTAGLAGVEVPTC
jgi:hypothetical protein